MRAASSVGCNDGCRCGSDSIDIRLRSNRERDGDGEVVDEVPPRITRFFGNAKARPRVKRVYDAASGWEPVGGSPVITWATIDALLSQGRTSVEIRWRFTTYVVSITDLNRAVSSAKERPIAAVGARRRRRVDAE